MENGSLNATTNQQAEQTTTNNPQASGQLAGTSTLTPVAGSTQSGSAVQPSTTTNLLTNQITGSLSVVKPVTGALSVPAATSQATVAAPAPKRHINAALLGISVTLCLVAVVLFWLTARSVKNTTEN